MSHSSAPKTPAVSPEETKGQGTLKLRLDEFQLNNRYLGFVYAVQRKYSQDQAGSLGALITYYGLLTLFPLLVAALSITQLSILHSAHLKSKVAVAVNSYLPIVGHQLQTDVRVEQKAGIALVTSVILALYGARGVTKALQLAFNDIWQIPIAMRARFPKKLLRSFGVLLVSGLGFLATGLLSSFAMAPSTFIFMRILAFIASLLITFIALMVVFQIGLSKHYRYKDFMYGSLIAACGLQIIQLLAGFIITHELKHFSSLYGSLALVFVVLFWIYLQVRIVLYATEIDTIRKFKLWPRSLSGTQVTDADRRVYKMYAKREVYLKPPNEAVKVNFRA